MTRPKLPDIADTRRDMAREHKEADERCARAWVCQCAACRMTRAEDGFAPIIRSWGELPGPATPDAAPAAPGDRVQLPAIRCSRAERDAWQRKAAARGVTLSELVRTYLEGLP